MNIIKNGIIKKFSYSIFSNLISTLSAAILLLIIPKFIGIADYGYWQLYLFYGSYLGYFHFGLLDGIYLRYGGKKYKDLDHGKLSFQFYLISFFNILILAILFVISFQLVSTNEKIIVTFLTVINGIILIPRLYLSYILQATGRIKEYSISLILDKGASLILIALACFLGFKNFYGFIILDIFAKVASLVYVFIKCSDLALTKPAPFRDVFPDLKLNMSAGIKIMLASLTSMLLIGIARFEIESIWNIETFAKISLTFSISNVLITFINSIAIVIFPILRNYPKDKLSSIYTIVKKILYLFIFACLIFYPLFSLAIKVYLPKYTEAITYMVILLPMSVFECKTCLLTNTFLKSIRLENEILFGNILTLIISVIASTISLYIFRNINLCLLLIVASIGFRSFYLEFKLKKHINISIDMFEELIMITCFIIFNLYFNIYITTILYSSIYACYFLWNRKYVKSIVSIYKSAKI